MAGNNHTSNGQKINRELPAAESCSNRVEAFEVGKEFINRKNKTITITKRFWTAKDVVEYLMASGNNEARVAHLKVLEKIEENEWTHA